MENFTGELAKIQAMYTELNKAMQNDNSTFFLAFWLLINYNIKMENFMDKAIEAAHEAGHEIPVGAVIVRDGAVIASAFNQKEAANDVSAHAEILALREASKKLGRWRLEDCEMYVTLEPCPMRRMADTLSA